MTAHQRARIEAYAAHYGASLAGAIIALAVRGLDALEDEKAHRASAGSAHYPRPQR